MLTSIVLRLIHHVISLGVFACSLVALVPKAYDVFRRKFITGEKLTVGDDSRKIDKLPVHVGFVVSENEFSFSDLANLIVWAVALGIHYISIYDINGEIKRKSILLNQEVQRKRTLFENAAISKHEIRIFPIMGQSTEGRHPDKRTANVHLLSAEDGQPAITNMAQRLCSQVAHGQCRIEDITTNHVDKLFQDMFQCPDPDMVLQFGPVTSLAGFLPWQSRLTEIISVPSHIGLSYSSFSSSLQQYSRTQQRCGK